MPKYDVVIIGSGLGGLECAYMLAKAGMSVCVLEKNRQFGGNLQIFARDKVIFDTGVHYIGGLEKGQNLYQYFKYFGLTDELKLRRMDEEGFDKISFENDSNEYPHAVGYQRFTEQLTEYFPKENGGIEKYLDAVKNMCDSFPLYNVESGNLVEVDLSLLNINAKDFIESCTSNEKLRQVLAGSNPLYAGYPEKTPFYVHAMTINTYLDSAWKCVDGGGQIARILVKNIKKLGGELRNYSEVKRFLFSEGKKIKAVELADNEVVEGGKFIANIHPAAVMNMIESSKIRPAYRNRIQGLQNGISVFTLHLVFKENAFPYLNHNIYYYKKEDVWSGVDYDPKNWPEGFAAFVPANSKSPDFADSMNVMTYMHFKEVEQWAHTFNTTPKYIDDRGEDYQNWKLEKAEKLLNVVEEKFPNIREKIRSFYVSTPLSYRDYINTPNGSMYGIVKDSRNPLKTFLMPKTKIPNLFFTGQNVNMHGMLGVTVSAFSTCGYFLGLDYLIEEVKKAQ